MKLISLFRNYKKCKRRKRKEGRNLCKNYLLNSLKFESEEQNTAQETLPTTQSPHPASSGQPSASTPPAPLSDEEKIVAIEKRINAQIYEAKSVLFEETWHYDSYETGGDPHANIVNADKNLQKVKKETDNHLKIIKAIQQLKEESLELQDKIIEEETKKYVHFINRYKGEIGKQELATKSEKIDKIVHSLQQEQKGKEEEIQKLQQTLFAHFYEPDNEAQAVTEGSQSTTPSPVNTGPFAPPKGGPTAFLPTHTVQFSPDGTITETTSVPGPHGEITETTTVTKPAQPTPAAPTVAAAAFSPHPEYQGAFAPPKKEPTAFRESMTLSLKRSGSERIGLSASAPPPPPPPPSKGEIESITPKRWYHPHLHKRHLLRGPQHPQWKRMQQAQQQLLSHQAPILSNGTGQ